MFEEPPGEQSGPASTVSPRQLFRTDPSGSLGVQNLTGSSFGAQVPESLAKSLREGPVLSVEWNSQFLLHAHVLTPIAVPSDPLDGTYLRYLKIARETIVNRQILAGDLTRLGDMDVGPLVTNLDPEGNLSAAAWTSSFVRRNCQTGNNDPDVVVRKMALAGLWTHFMQWIVNPTLASYNRVPDMMKPILLQLLIPHASHIDLVIFPEVREAVLQQEPGMQILNATNGGVALEEYFLCNWPHGKREVFDPNTCRLTPRFVEYIGIKENWSIKTSVANRFPALQPFLMTSGLAVEG